MFPNDKNAKYNGPRVVVYGGTRNLYERMARSAKSLIFHNDVDRIIFMIEDDEFNYSEKLPDIITCINVSDQQYFPKFGANYNTRSTYMSLMRVALFDMLPDYDRVLWLDDDTYIFDDIGELFNVPLEDKYYAAMTEEIENYIESVQILRSRGLYVGRTYPKRMDYSYYNDGVAVLNLKKLRDGMGNTLINALNENRWGCADQDAFNEFCHDEIYLLSPEYNVAHFSKQLPYNTHAKIFHYSGLDDNEITISRNERYDNLTFEEIINWRKARKEYLDNVRIQK